MIHYIKPDDKGNSCFGFIPKSKFGPEDSITTDRCYRCFGGFVLLERKEGVSEDIAPETAVIAFHITPGKLSYTKNISRYFFRYIDSRIGDFNVVKMIRCGGVIDSEQDRHLFNIMKKKMEVRFMKKFPQSIIEGIYPEIDTHCMELVISGDLKVVTNHSKKLLAD